MLEYSVVFLFFGYILINTVILGDSNIFNVRLLLIYLIIFQVLYRSWINVQTLGKM